MNTRAMGASSPTSHAGRWNRVSPGAAALALVILALSPELKFRVRDATAAFAGTPDAQVVVELLIWMTIGAWLGWHLIRGLAKETYSWRQLRVGLRTQIAVAGFVVVAGTYSFSIRSGIRALQYAVITGIALLVFWEAVRDRAFIIEFWIWIRRGVIAVAVLASLATVFIGLGPLQSGKGFLRYRWFAMHPIPTAGILSLALIMLASAHFGLRDRALTRRWGRVLSLPLALVLGLLLLATRSRTAIGGTFLALLLMLPLMPRRTLRRGAALTLGGTILAALFVFSLGVGEGQVVDLVTRGQTAEQIQSLSQRTDLINIGIDLFQDRPIFGHGYLAAGPLYKTYFSWAGESHNLFAEIIVSTGSAGLLAFGSLLVVAIRQLIHSLRSPRAFETGLPMEATGIMLLVVAMGVVTDSFAGAVGYEMAGLLLVLLISDAMASPANRPRRQVSVASHRP